MPFLVGLLAGAVAVGTAWFASVGGEAQAGIVDVGSYDEFVRAGTFAPVLYARDTFYLVTAEAGEPRALYAYPPPAQFQQRLNCAVIWQETVVGVDGGGFRDRCFGATFARDGSYLFGPSSRPLDQFRVEVKDGRILVDTRRLLCDGRGPCKRL